MTIIDGGLLIEPDMTFRNIVCALRQVAVKMKLPEFWLLTIGRVSEGKRAPIGCIGNLTCSRLHKYAHSSKASGGFTMMLTVLAGGFSGKNSESSQAKYRVFPENLDH